MKTIGLIGGMSYTSTITYYEFLNTLTNAHFRDLTTPKIILNSLNFSHIEKLQHQNDWESLGSILNKEAVNLEQAGAEILALCTNTMHKVADQMMKNISIPFVHIAEATANIIAEQRYKKPALLATKFTMEEDFYNLILTKHGLEPIIPSQSSRDILHSVIYDELCLNIKTDKSTEKFLEITQEVIESGADSVILGCTEVGMLLNNENVELPVFDTVELHCKEILNQAL